MSVIKKVGLATIAAALVGALAAGPAQAGTGSARVVLPSAPNKPICDVDYTFSGTGGVSGNTITSTSITPVDCSPTVTINDLSATFNPSGVADVSVDADVDIVAGSTVLATCHIHRTVTGVWRAPDSSPSVFSGRFATLVSGASSPASAFDATWAASDWAAAFTDWSGTLASVPLTGGFLCSLASPAQATATLFNNTN